jgi:hypothetical protein
MAAIEVSASHINIRRFFKMNEWNKVSIKQSHKSMNKKKTAQLETAIKKRLSGRLFFAIRFRSDKVWIFFK